MPLDVVIKKVDIEYWTHSYIGHKGWFPFSLLLSFHTIHSFMMMLQWVCLSSALYTYNYLVDAQYAITVKMKINV